MKAASLPQFARDLLSACPTAGAGVHNWLFRVARSLHQFYPNKRELYRVIATACEDCGRYVSPGEIDDSISNSQGCAWKPQKGPGQGRANPRWPARNLEQIKEIVDSGISLCDLWERSRMSFRDSNSHAEEIVDLLFPGNPLLCCGVTSYSFATQLRGAWRSRLDQLAFMVPSPMSSVHGLTKEGKKSEHTLDNTGPRRFLVVEFDFREKDKAGDDTPDAELIRAMAAVGKDVADICAALLWHLAQLGPLAAVVHSGGKSLHGWFFCLDQPESKLIRFMRYAVSVGADPATWTRSQFVRMPDGRRDNGNRQRVYYLNPKVLP